MCIGRADGEPYWVARQMVIAFGNHTGLQQDFGVLMFVGVTCPKTRHSVLSRNKALHPNVEMIFFVQWDFGLSWKTAYELENTIWSD